MEVKIEEIGKRLLEAPVGYVEQTMSEIIKKQVYIKVLEQNSVSDTSYVRKVEIGYNLFPILRAKVTFDSKNIPKPVMEELLQKKKSIGKILRKNNVSAERRQKSIEFDQTRKMVTREYEIFCSGLLWFQVREEIRLDFLYACKDS